MESRRIVLTDGVSEDTEYAPSPRDYVRETVELYERTGGAEGSTLQGKPTIILTTVGNKSGKIRKTPLMRVEHDGRYAVVASMGGAPTHPVWYHNIAANPDVQLQDGPDKAEYRARELHGPEKAEWWDRAIQAWPDYANYQTKTTREIPVFLLEPR
jgi:deazaflavin-dependent oxidoreductase (nitroreductase family)